MPEDLCLGTYGDPMGVGVSYERGVPVLGTSFFGSERRLEADVARVGDVSSRETERSTPNLEERERWMPMETQSSSDRLRPLKMAASSVDDFIFRTLLS